MPRTPTWSFWPPPTVLPPPPISPCRGRARCRRLGSFPALFLADSCCSSASSSFLSIFRCVAPMSSDVLGPRSGRLGWLRPMAFPPREFPRSVIRTVRSRAERCGRRSGPRPRERNGSIREPVASTSAGSKLLRCRRPPMRDRPTTACRPITTVIPVTTTANHLIGEGLRRVMTPSGRTPV